MTVAARLIMTVSPCMLITFIPFWLYTTSFLLSSLVIVFSSLFSSFDGDAPMGKLVVQLSDLTENVFLARRD